MRQAGVVGVRMASLAMGGLALLALSPVPTPAQDIQTDYDRSFDFSTLRTYAYVVQARGPNDPLVVNPMNDRRVRAALDSQLVARGYTADTGGTPDFLVAYHAATRNRLDVREWGYGPGRWGNRRIDVNEHTEGTLVVDIVDAASQELVWRGIATGTIEPDEADKKIKRAVAKLIEEFAKDTKPKS